MPTEKNRQNNFFSVCNPCKDKGCCQDTRPPISAKRKKIIESYLERQKIPIKDAFVKAEYTFPKANAKGYCVFYNNKTMKCLIHPVKPETCVAGPVTFDIKAPKQKIQWFLKKEKICPLAGLLCKDEERLKKHFESAKKEILRLVKELDPEALNAILKIEEPETFQLSEDIFDDNTLKKLTSNS